MDGAGKLETEARIAPLKCFAKAHRLAGLTTAPESQLFLLPSTVAQQSIHGACMA